MVKTKRDRPSDLSQHPFQLVAGDGGKRSADGAHTAADIDADRIGDHHFCRGYDPADGHAIALMGIRHHRHVLKDKGKIGQIAGLLKGTGFDIIQPEFDRFFFGRDYLFHKKSSPLAWLLTYSLKLRDRGK